MILHARFPTRPSLVPCPAPARPRFATSSLPPRAFLLLLLILHRLRSVFNSFFALTIFVAAYFSLRRSRLLVFLVIGLRSDSSPLFRLCGGSSGFYSVRKISCIFVGELRLGRQVLAICVSRLHCAFPICLLFPPALRSSPHPSTFNLARTLNTPSSLQYLYSASSHQTRAAYHVCSSQNPAYTLLLSSTTSPTSHFALHDHQHFPITLQAPDSLSRRSPAPAGFIGNSWCT